MHTRIGIPLPKRGGDLAYAPTVIKRRPAPVADVRIRLYYWPNQKDDRTFGVVYQNAAARDDLIGRLAAHAGKRPIMILEGDFPICDVPRATLREAWTREATRAGAILALGLATTL